LRKLPGRLQGYARSAYLANVVLLVLVDRDDDDCLELKRRIERIATDSGLRPLRNQGVAAGGCVKVRVACEELEAWYLGDPVAFGRFTPDRRGPSSGVGRRRRVRQVRRAGPGVAAHLPGVAGLGLGPRRLSGGGDAVRRGGRLLAGVRGDRPGA